MSLAASASKSDPSGCCTSTSPSRTPTEASARRRAWMGDVRVLGGRERELGGPAAQPGDEARPQEEEVAIALLSHGAERALQRAVGSSGVGVETRREDGGLRFGVARADARGALRGRAVPGIGA